MSGDGRAHGARGRTGACKSRHKEWDACEKYDLRRFSDSFELLCFCGLLKRSEVVKMQPALCLGHREQFWHLPRDLSEFVRGSPKGANLLALSTLGLELASVIVQVLWGILRHSRCARRLEQWNTQGLIRPSFAFQKYAPMLASIMALGTLLQSSTSLLSLMIQHKGFSD